MQIENARLILRGAQEDARTYAEQADVLFRRSEGAKQVIKGILTMFPELADEGPPPADPMQVPLIAAATAAEPVAAGGEERPPTPTAILTVLREDFGLGRHVSPDAILSALDRRGWMPVGKDPEGAARVSIRRLWQAEKIVRVRPKRGRGYHYGLLGPLSQVAPETEEE